MRSVLLDGKIQYLHQRAVFQIYHHIRIDDVGVFFQQIHAIVFVGADFIVFPGMLAQIQLRVFADAPHTRLEMTGFVFVRNNANTSVLRIFFHRLKRAIPVFREKDQRSKPEITLLRVIFFQSSDA